jgi:hypothetical protein
MHVVAAAFPDVEEAAAAESELRQQLDVEGRDIKVAPAGGDPGRSGLRGLLAGRFRLHRRELVEEVVQRHCGEVVDDRPEDQIRPPRAAIERGNIPLAPVEPPRLPLVPTRVLDLRPACTRPVAVRRAAILEPLEHTFRHLFRRATATAQPTERAGTGLRMPGRGALAFPGARAMPEVEGRRRRGMAHRRRAHATHRRGAPTLAARPWSQRTSPPRAGSRAPSHPTGWAAARRAGEGLQRRADAAASRVPDHAGCGSRRRRQVGKRSAGGRPSIFGSIAKRVGSAMAARIARRPSFATSWGRTSSISNQGYDHGSPG